MQQDKVELAGVTGFIVICGNDGSGKTSTARLLNEHFHNGKSTLYAFERSTKPTDSTLIQLKTAISPKAIDDITFIYPFEARPDLCWSVDYDGKSLPVYWIMLDVEIPEIERRIHGRLQQTIYEVRKCIQYYQRVYRQQAAYYGIPLVPTDHIAPAEVAWLILELIANKQYSSIHQLAFRDFNQALLDQHDLQRLIEREVIEGRTVVDAVPKSLTDELIQDGLFGQEQLEILKSDIKLKAKLLAKWLVDKGAITEDKEDAFLISREGLAVQVKSTWVLRLIIEGESKKLYQIVLPRSNKYFQGQVVILLKSTIYSHTNQHTGLIKDLAKVRAMGSSILIDLMMRNDLHHAYRCVASDGIILSDFKDITPVEVVFKKYWVGTDKHSYYGLDSNLYKEKIVHHDNHGLYSSGVYIRFDWRNPNHVSLKTQKALADNPYYYAMEEYIGKERFFEKYIRDEKKCKPFGDKCVYPEVINGICNLQKIRKSVIKLYCTFKHYMDKLGLELIDGCFMLDKTGEVFWSEINPDCMRIRASTMIEKYDKDIWRAGGSSSKEEIMKKWVALNQLLMDYLKKNRFHEGELHEYNSLPHQLEAEAILQQKDIQLSTEYRNIYRELVCPQKNKKRFIATIDMFEGKPALVKSSQVFDTHSNGKVEEAFSKLIPYFDEILMVDLNGSMKDSKEASKANRQLIKQCNKQKKVMAGGGIHTIADVQELLQEGVKKIVIGSNTDKEFIERIPKDRLIVELSVNQQSEVLIEGRKVNTKVKAITKVLELVALGVEAFSFTLVKSQGHLQGLDRSALRKLLVEIPRFVKTIIVAGGITSLDDLKFLWSFDRVIPQLGSAIWKGKIAPGDIIAEAANYDEHELLPTVVSTSAGKVKGLVYLNREAIIKTCQTGQLWRYSRQHNRLMMKGQTSGDIQQVQHVSLDCDGDTLLVTVDDSKNFCHQGTLSCFDI